MNPRIKAIRLYQEPKASRKIVKVDVETFRILATDSVQADKLIREWNGSGEWSWRK